jgi:hypothetical protein
MDRGYNSGFDYEASQVKLELLAGSKDAASNIAVL